MSKRRHRNSRKESSNDSANNRQQFNNNPFGINPAQLLSMFGNIDMNQINSMLQSMNTEGFDLNNLNLGPLQNMMSGTGNVPGRQGREANSRTSESDKEHKRNRVSNDENIQMLIAIKSIVSDEKAIFIDKIIKLYNEGAFDD